MFRGGYTYAKNTKQLQMFHLTLNHDLSRLSTYGINGKGEKWGVRTSLESQKV